MEFEKERTAYEKVSEGTENLSETQRKLLDFFGRFGKTPEKIHAFEGNIMAAKNTRLKGEVDGVLDHIQQIAQNDPESQHHQTLQQLQTADEGQRTIELCLFCGMQKHDCSGYTSQGENWPYMREFTIED